MNATAQSLTQPTGPRRIDGHLPIGDYAPIGDGHSLALVGADGSIDWMCAPELDAPSVFAAVLDPADGGSFSLAPAIPFTTSRRYLERTNVLVTEYTTDEGVVRVTEALTIDTGQNAPWRELVRRVEGASGAVPMEWRLRPRFEFGRSVSEPTERAGALLWRHQRLQLGLRCWEAGDPKVADGTAQGSFTAREGESSMLVLFASDAVALPVPDRKDVERRLKATVEHWRDWLAGSSYDGPWKDAVERSLLALRLVTDDRTGAIAAAGTTSLPEVIGGKRNYDYRFAWVRDLSFTVDALLRVGMRELSDASVAWLLKAVSRTHPRIDPVYTLTGEVLRSQESLELPGYRGSPPVHIGNKAGSQLQLGGFGDLMETVWRYADCGNLLAPETGERLADSADLLCAIWQREDAGLWELGDYAHYTTSKIGCWTALERILDLAEQGQVPARHVDRWRTERDRIRRFIDERLWSDSKQSYVMKAGSEMLDCGVLLAARRGYTDPTGPRMNATIDAIQRELHAEGPLYYRYSGMADEENAFLACSFWMVEALALAERRDEASELMEGIVALSSDIGLFSEEMEPGSHELRGNFPQALTHLALISAAAMLDRE